MAIFAYIVLHFIMKTKTRIMRKYYIFFFLLIATQLSGQKQHFKGVANLDYASQALDKQFTEYQVIDFSTEGLKKEVFKRDYQDVFVLEFSKKHKWEIFLYENEIRSKNYTVKVNNEQGEFEVAPSAVKTFSGILNNSRGEKVSLTIGKDFIYGFITENGTRYFIEPASYFDTKAKKNQFVVYSEKDVIPSKDNKCGVTDLQEHAHDHEHSEENVTSDRSSQACYEVELAIGSDYKMFQKYGDQAGVENHNIGIMNNVNTDYDDSFNEEIKFKIVTQYISTCNSCDPWSATTDPFQLLPDFQNWGNGGGFGITFDLGQLMTARDFNGGTIGLASTAEVACTNSKYHTVQDFTSNGSLIRVVVSHEIGHNFAYVHDAGGSPFIMAPAVQNTNTWSVPSQDRINITIANKIGSCFSACSTAPPPPPGGSGPPLEVSFVKNDETCFGYEDGEICLFISGGGEPYNVFWSTFGVVGECYSDLSPGTYSCTVVDALFNSFELNDVEILGPDSELELELIEIIPDDCEADQFYSGSIEVQAFGGSAPYFYFWTDNHLDFNPPGLATKDYYVTVFDSYGCEQEFGPFFVPAGNPPDIVASLASGFDCNTNVALVEGAGDDVGGDFTYSWSTNDGNIVSGETSVQATVDQAGTYTLTVINNVDGCENSTSVEVTASADIPMAIIELPTILDCQTTSIELDASNSSTGTEFSFSWEVSNGGSIISGESTLNPTVDAAGTYTLIISNTTNGCEGTTSVDVEDNSIVLDVTFDDPAALTCTNQMIPFSVTASGTNLTYVWTTPSGAAPMLINDSTIELVEAGNYTLLVTDLDNGCTFEATIPVEANTTAPIADAGAQLVIGCNSDAIILDGTNSSTGTNFTYLWTTNDGNIVSNDASLNPEVDQGGTYILVVTDNDNGCTEMSSTLVSEDISAPDPSLSTNGAIDCTSTMVNITAEDLANLDVSYNWTSQDGNIVSGANTDEILVDAAGTYEVEMINLSNGCSTIESITVSADQNDPIASAGNEIELNCNSTTAILDGSASSIGNNFTYQWFGPGIVSGADGLNPTINQAGVYLIEVTNTDNGCVSEASVSISIDADFPMLSLSTMPETAPMAADGSVTVSASNVSNGTYEWTDSNGMVVGTTPTVNNLAPGTYCVLVSNTDNGCEQNNCITVLEGVDPCVNSNFGVDIDSEFLTCILTEVDLVATGIDGEGTSTFVWSDGTIGSVLTVSEAGSYSVIATDELGCTSETSIQVVSSTNAPAVLSTQTNETSQGANDGSISVMNLDDEPLYDYQWTDAMGNVIGTSFVINNLAPGEYCLLVTNQITGCTLEECFTITGGSDPCSMGIEVVIEPLNETTITCVNTLVSLDAVVQGGTEPFDYLWNTGSEDESIEVSDGGEYSVIITDSNGCTATNVFTVDASIDLPEFTLIGTDETSSGASDGTITLNTSETDITYIWRDASGAIIGEDLIVEGLSPGQYCIEVVFNSTGCSLIECYTILEGGDPCAEAPIVIINNLNDEVLSCIVPFVTLEAIASGGNGTLTYLWNFNDSNDSSIEVFEPGVYIVIVTDENGCTATQEIEVLFADVESPFVTVSSTPETIEGAADGTVMVDANGNLEFEWTDAAGNVISTEATVSNLAPGEYCLLATNPISGCTVDACIEVLGGEDPCIGFSVIAESYAVLCAGDSNGSADVEVTGGTGPFDVVLNGIAITSFTGNTFTTPANLPSGLTVIQIEDTNGCSVDVELEINEPEVLEVGVVTTGENSPGSADGSATATGSGGTGTYSYLWSNGNTTQEISNLQADEYCVTITDENGCTAESCFEITEGEDPCENFELILSAGDVSCFGASDGYAGIETQGTTGDLTVVWSNGLTGGYNAELSAGIYTIEVTDENDCSGMIEFEISEPAEIMLDVTGINESSLGSGDGSADASVTGGTGDYTFSWTGSNNFSNTNQDLEGLESGTYCLVVTDSNGCVSEEFCIDIEAGSDPCADFEASISTIDVLCKGENNGQAAIEIVNGTLPFTYDWSAGNSTTSTNDELTAGTISVLITDGNDCQIELEAVISEPAQELSVNVANVTAETDTGASDGTIELDIAGGTLPYELIWDNGASSENQDNLPCGTYSVTVIDGNACQVETSVTVPCQDLGCETLQADIQMNAVSCFGNTDGGIEIFPSGGMAPYEVSLNSGQSGTSINNLPASLYVVLVEDANGCLFTQDITVTSPAELESEIFGTDGLCGAMSLAQVIPFGGTSPYTLEWSNGSTGGVITNLDSGTYTVTITDANNCISTNLITVENIYNPAEFEVQIGHVLCNGDANGFINLEVIDGDGPFTYEWSNGSTNPELFDLSAGEYSVIITDRNGCDYALSRTIIEPNPIEMDYAINQGGTSTTFDVKLNVSGGTAPYTYDWSDGSNSIINTGMQVGSYTVTILDDRGCEQTFDVLIDGSLTGIASLEILESFQVYPNPTKDQVYFIAELSEKAQLDIFVYNALGQLIFQDKAEGSSIKKDIDLSEQAVGTYFLQVGNSKGQVVEKILKID